MCPVDLSNLMCKCAIEHFAITELEFLRNTRSLLVIIANAENDFLNATSAVSKRVEDMNKLQQTYFEDQQRVSCTLTSNDVAVRDVISTDHTIARNCRDANIA